MDINGLNSAPAAFTARGYANGITSAIKDIQGAQLTINTLDRMNTRMTLAGPVVNPDYQFQKDVLGAYGLGNRIDMKI